ncbi:MAG: hypothetical protein V4673_12905 [Pseudomonadota bacterium]
MAQGAANVSGPAAEPAAAGADLPAFADEVRGQSGKPVDNPPQAQDPAQLSTPEQANAGRGR